MPGKRSIDISTLTKTELNNRENMEFTLPANLLEELDKTVMVWLRDGRTVIGTLRSVDQFANLVLQGTIERVYVGDKYGDIFRGIFLIRGENVALLGDVERGKEQPNSLTEVSIPEILQLQELEHETKKNKEKVLARAFKKQGLSYNANDSSLELL